MMQTSEYMHETAGSLVSEEVKNSWKSFVALGVLMVVLGITEILFPLSATFSVALIVGTVLVAAGVTQLAQVACVPRWKGSLMLMARAVIALLVGGLLLFYPFAGVLALTLFIAAFFLISGILRVFLAARLRPSDHWIWVMTGGFLSLLMSVLMLVASPGATLWLAGILVGIDIAYAGSILTVLGLTGLYETDSHNLAFVLADTEEGTHHEEY